MRTARCSDRDDTRSSPTTVALVVDWLSSGLPNFATTTGMDGFSRDVTSCNCTQLLANCYTVVIPPGRFVCRGGWATTRRAALARVARLPFLLLSTYHATMKTSLYVDGMNAYYGFYAYQRDKCTPADKWLDWRSLGDRLVGADSTLHHIHYFTAYRHRTGPDPDQNLRQVLYFRALETIPGFTLHQGKHIPVSRRGTLSKPLARALGWPPSDPITVNTFEEKGSDVNLAVRLVDDAWRGEIDRAVVMSNDTDLLEAIRVARRHIRVDVVSPQPTLAKELRKAAEYSWCLDVTMLRECRLEIPRQARDGTLLFPPDSWLLEEWPAHDMNRSLPDEP